MPLKSYVPLFKDRHESIVIIQREGWPSLVFRTGKEIFTAQTGARAEQSGRKLDTPGREEIRGRAFIELTPTFCFCLDDFQGLFISFPDMREAQGVIKLRLSLDLDDILSDI